MKKTIFNDLFTESIGVSKLYHPNMLRKALLELDPELIKNIGTPITKNYGNLYEILEEITESGNLGSDHVLFEKYSKKYGDNGMSSNIVIPFLNIHEFQSNKYPKIKDLVIINDPDDAERISSQNVRKMPNFKPLLHDSIISTTDNDHWKNQRKELTSAFDPFSSLSVILNISYERAKKCSKLLWKMSHSGSSKVNMSEFYLNETQAQLQLAMFGLSNEFQEETNQKIRDAFAGMGETGYARKFAFDLIEEMKNSNGPLSNSLNDRSPLTDTEKYGNALIFAFAGHDTTGHTLAWLTYELAKNHNYQKKLQREVDKFWNENGSDITIASFKKLPFMTRCIMETLRLWTAVPNGSFRQLDRDENIRGLNNKQVKLKKGTYVQLFNWNRHRNPDLWGEDADLFNPDREFKDGEIWEEQGYMFYNPASDRFSPFSYPGRDCIGKNFAHMEMRLILLHLIRDYNFILTEQQASTVYDDNYKGSNRATLGPVDVYNPINQHNKGLRPFNIGMYMYVSKRHTNI